MSCQNQRAQQLLDALFLEELGDDDHVWLRAHAETCERCRSSYEKLTAVQAHLEGAASGIPTDRLRFLEAQVLGRVQPRPSSRAQAVWWRWLVPVVGVVATAGVLAFVVPGRPPDPREWQARTGTGEAWGVRAFCVAPGKPPQVTADAAPGQTLLCPPGSAIQFTYTAPESAALALSARDPRGEVLTFFPEHGRPAQISAGTDVPLDFSTSVGSWLGRGVEVRAEFRDASSGAVLGESTLEISPE